MGEGSILKRKEDGPDGKFPYHHSNAPLMHDEERYEIKGKIGEGGRGAVYRAFDRQLNRPVAIKRLFTEDPEDDDSHDAVMKESHALSALNSPHIVRLFDVARDEEGPYVVMELLEGKTLHEVVSEAPMVVADFLTVAEQSLEALIAAHDAKLLHRDIKPGNLMLTWLPSGRIQLKLLDFGLAKFTEKPQVQTVAQKGSVLGSIYFMAPEQFERTPLDGRTDLYSLGCVLFHALTGRYPFTGDSVTEVMAAHIQGQHEDLQPLRPDLSPALCQWVTSLMAREQDLRPANAQAALQAFDVAKKATAPVNTAAVPAPPQAVVPGFDPATGMVHTGAHLTGTQNISLHTATTAIPGLHTGQIPTNTTAVVPGKLVSKTGLSPAILAVCGVLILTIVALGVAVAVRGDGDGDKSSNTDPVEEEEKEKPEVKPKNRVIKVELPKPDPPKPKPEPPKPPPLKYEDFSKLDTDQDFKVTEEEFIATTPQPKKRAQRQLFKKLDRNKNGVLTFNEFKDRQHLNK